MGIELLASWLAGLIWHVSRGGAFEIFLDIAAAAAGAFLALWTVAALQGQYALGPQEFVWALYPILDVIALALSTHLALRLERGVTAWWFVIVAMVMQLLLDTTHAVRSISTDPAAAGTPLPSLTLPYLFT